LKRSFSAARERSRSVRGLRIASEMIGGIEHIRLE